MGIEAHAWGSHDDTLRCCGISRDFAWSAVGTFDKNEVGDEVSDNGLSQVKVGSKEEGLHRVLVRGDRTVSMGKGGLEMGENFGSGGPMGGGDGGVGDGRTASEQGGADRGLATIEAFPESLPGARASWRAGVATRGHGPDRRREAAGDGKLKEAPQRAGTQAQASEFLGDPDAEGASAAIVSMAFAAIDSPGTKRLAWRAGVVESAEEAMANEVADLVAVRARHELESFFEGGPFVFGAVKM